MSMMTIDPDRIAGWEPGTPASDSLLQAFLRNWTGADVALGTALGARILRRDDVVAVNVGRPAFIVNAATLLAPLFPDGAAGMMATLEAFYGFTEGAKNGRVLLFSAWPTPELRDHGWTLLGHAPLMLRAAGGAIPAPPDGCRVVPVADATTLRDAEQVTVRGFSIADPILHQPGTLFGASLLDDARMRMWVAYEGDIPVSTSAAFVSEGITNIINVATIPEARRRGYASAVTWPATLADPSLPTMLIASNQGRPVYERMGYMTLFRFTLWSRSSPA